MIEIFDNFLDDSEIERLYEICTLLEFSLQGRSKMSHHKDYQDREISLIKVVDKDLKSYNFFKKIQDKISDKLGTEYSHFLSYINAFKFSDASLSHTDFTLPNKLGLSKTALIYCNKEWDIDWGGETIFMDKLTKDAEIIKSIIPKPGRLVIFDSEIPHAARMPNILYPLYKYTFVNRFSR